MEQAVWFMWFVLFFFSLLLSSSTGLYLTGKVVVNSNEIISNRYRYLGKFGAKKASSVFVYGNSLRTSAENVDEEYDSVQLAFVPESVWNSFKETVDSSDSDCDRTIMPLFNATYLADCHPNGYQYYLRTLPCEAECENQEPGIYVPQGSQFSYLAVPEKTEYWFAFLVYCAQNFTFTEACTWQPSQLINFTYNLSIVNSEPFEDEHHPDPFTFQFPYNLHGFLITYMVFGCLYTMLVPTHILMHSRLCAGSEYRLHPMVWLFSAALVLEAMNVCFGLLNYSVYAFNGQGIPWLSYVAEGWNLLGDWFLILVFILIAGGWQVTRKTVKWKYASFPIWVLYVVFSALYFVFFITHQQVRPWDVTIPLHYWAGGVYLSCRGLVLFYVWYQLWHIYRQENSRLKLRVYQVFFAFFTFWFWYLLLVAFIVIFVNIVVQRLIVINISLSVNFWANLLMVLLFCPKWAHEYFQFQSYYHDPMSLSGRVMVYHELESEPSSRVL